MKLSTRLLSAAARRPLLALAIVAAVPVLGAAVALRPTAPRHAEPAGEALDTLDSPRAILGRVWFDKYPEKRSDDVQVFIWLAGGIGIHESGSSYRLTMDLFEFERQGDKVAMQWLHDKKKVETKFTISKCDDEPPFDLCLDLANSPRGPKRYYGFDYGDDMDAKVPWARGILRAAEVRAASK